MTRLMSFCTRPTVAAKNAVAAPTITTTIFASGAYSNIGDSRHTMKTPAVTMVAAWISADTGVGPSIASNSQDCNGTCADLPHAPRSSSSPMINAVVAPTLGMPSLTSRNDDDPKVASMSMMARDMPMSPTRLTTNAFLAAVAATGLYCQNPMSRYDARPTPSQPTKSTR